MNIAAVQSHPQRGDLAITCDRLASQMKQAAAAAAEWLVLPELAGSGYALADRAAVRAVAEAADGSGPFLGWLLARCREYGFALVTGFAETDGEQCFNAAALLDGDGVHACYRKVHLFDREQELFTPGDAPAPVCVHRGTRVGLAVCWDWAFPELWRGLGLGGAEWVAHPCNLVLPYAQSAMPGHALCNRFHIVTANRVGVEDSLHFTGRSQITSAHGTVLAQASASSPELLIAELDLESTHDKWATPRNHLFTDRRPEHYLDR